MELNSKSEFKTDLNFGHNPQTCSKWTDTHISCSCRETRSPPAEPQTPSQGQGAFLIFCRCQHQLRQGESITSPFTAHPVGPWVLCQLLPFSRQFTWVDFNEMVKNATAQIAHFSLLQMDRRKKNFSLTSSHYYKKSGVSKRIQKMTVNFFEREPKSFSWSLRSWT